MAAINPPNERECLRCGRQDVWDDHRETWVATSKDGITRRGEPHCLHEWDINGNYNPFEAE